MMHAINEQALSAADTRDYASGSVRTWVSPPPVQWFWLTIVGVTVLTGHFCMINALRKSDATVVVPMDFLRLPLIAIVGAVYYGEHPDVFMLIGASLIFTGNGINIHTERRDLNKAYTAEQRLVSDTR